MSLQSFGAWIGAEIYGVSSAPKCNFGADKSIYLGHFIVQIQANYINYSFKSNPNCILFTLSAPGDLIKKITFQNCGMAVAFIDLVSNTMETKKLRKLTTGDINFRRNDTQPDPQEESAV